MSADAKITIKGDATDLERALGVGQAALRDFGNAAQSAIGSSMQQVATSLVNVATAAGQVNFSSQAAQVREFEASSARLAVSMGRDQEQVRVSLEATGNELGKKPQEIAQWTSEVGKLTYSFEGAQAGLKGITGLASLTGRQANDYKGLAVELATVAKVGGDTSDAIGRIVSQSKALGVQGGAAAFADQITALSGTISQFAVSSQSDFMKVTALAGELGKGLSPQAAGRVQQSAFGAIANDPLKWERYLGHQILDKHGHVEDPAKVMQEITEKTKKRYGGDARRVLMLNFGAETGSAMFNADFKEAAKVSGLAASSSPQAAREAYLQTDAGKRDQAAAQLDVSSRHLLGSSTMLGKAADAMQRFAASSPITATVVSGALAAGASGFMGAFGKTMSGIMSGGSKDAGGIGGLIGAAKGAGGSALMTGAGLGIIGLAGAAGVYGVQKFDEAMDDRVAGENDADVKVNEHHIANRRLAAERKKKIAAAEAGGMSHGMAIFSVDHPDSAAGGGAGGAGGAKAAAGNKALAAEVGAAVKASMKEVKLQVNFPNGPQEIAESGRQSQAAGNMSHG